jgi:rod shape-determining protein MreC
MTSSERLRQPLVVLLGLLLVWFFLPVALKRAHSLAFHEIQAPLWKLEGAATNLQDDLAALSHSKRDLLEAGRDQARMRAADELVRSENTALRARVTELEALFGLPSDRDHLTEVCTVVRPDFRAWWHRAMLLKGGEHGLVQGAPAIFAGGVAGRVVDVRRDTAVLQMVSSRDFRLAAKFKDDPRPLVYQGEPSSPFQPPSGRVGNVPRDFTASPDKPLILMTSGLGGFFPPGLVIGRVEHLEPDSSGIFQTGRVLLDERIYALREVSVLIPLRLPPTGE